MRSFEVQIAEFANKTEKRIDYVRRKSVLELLKSLVNMNPVDSGRSQNSWRVALDAPDLSVAQEGGYSPDKQAAESKVIAQATRILEQMNPDDVIYVSNNLPYIVPLEDGHSKQAPSGFVGISVQRMKYLVLVATREAKQKNP